LLEFSASRAQAGALHGPFVGMAWVEFSRTLRGAAPQSDGGLWLQAASALFAAGRLGEASAAFAEAEQRLPAELVRDAPPDPSVAELWHTRND
jgi:hypothetical protein